MIALDIGDVPETSACYLLHQYYLELPRDEAVCPKSPIWSSFEPAMVAKVLPHVAVLKRQDGNIGSFKQTIIGETHIGLISENKMGRTLDESLAPSKKEEHYGALTQVIDSRRPSYHIAAMPYAGREFMKILRGCFPFCQCSGEISHLIVTAEDIQTFPSLAAAYPGPIPGNHGEGTNQLLGRTRSG